MPGPLAALMLVLGLSLWSCRSRVVSAADSGPAPVDPSIARFVAGYFETWSARDLGAYATCFMPGATVTTIDGDGSRRSSSLKAFLEDQERFLSVVRSAQERPLSLTTSPGDSGATCTVRWELSYGGTCLNGIDAFDLVPSGGGWRIRGLVVTLPP